MIYFQCFTCKQNHKDLAQIWACLMMAGKVDMPPRREK